MGRRLILDTNGLIAYERDQINRAALDDDELAIAAVSVAEYRVGIELADTATRAADQHSPRSPQPSTCSTTPRRQPSTTPASSPTSAKPEHLAAHTTS